MDHNNNTRIAPISCQKLHNPSPSYTIKTPGILESEGEGILLKRTYFRTEVQRRRSRRLAMRAPLPGPSAVYGLHPPLTAIRHAAQLLAHSPHLSHTDLTRVCFIQDQCDRLQQALQSNDSPPASLDAYLTSLERNAVMNALHTSLGNKTKAAKLLGISFRTLRYRLKKLGLENAP